ncbi:unnamed protein product [Orchesella dallaii]|uniref:Uncharacterized protein n=1 Tax=Orchesella dallaii TaxID=48710 RepID=A0ABP1PY01_9HEXA
MNEEEEYVRTSVELDVSCGEQRQGRTKPHLYSTQENLAILREVLVENPFGKKCSKDWKSIMTEIKKKRLHKDEYLTMPEKSDDTEHESRTLTLKLDERRFTLYDREMAIKEEHEAHRRKQERRQPILEQKRMEMEVRKANQKESNFFFTL